MKYWFVPCRESTFLVDAALKANQNEKGNTFVDWRQSNNFAVGDIVFIYKMFPKSQISYRMEVTAIDLNIDEATDKEVFWKDKSLFYDGFGTHKYVRFSLLVEYPDGMFGLEELRSHGLIWKTQSVKECTNERLLAYLNGEITEDGSEKDSSGTDSLGEPGTFTEGELHEVVCNQYERNRKAREACITLKGYRCAVCGMDFESLYGEIGRGFIHVHHLIPISSIGESYDVNPATDLVPVCPNCHNILHKKEPPYTIEELKGMLL